MRILIIEDEHKLAHALRRGLQQESYAVDVSYDADDGLAMASTEPYDLIVIDRMIPGETDGIGVIKQLRSEKNHTPIIMLTARDSVRDRVTGLDAGADDYVVKPFAFAELLARIRALLRRPAVESESVLSYSDLSLNPATYEVRRQNTRIKLSNREFALLEYMLRNAERILTKTSIIGHVWDYDANVLPNTVEVYIRYLRNKIDKPFDGPPLIHTIRGFGYKLSERE
jgi:two-component system, OmpR family, response regulator